MVLLYGMNATVVLAGIDIDTTIKPKGAVWRWLETFFLGIFILLSLFWPPLLQSFSCLLKLLCLLPKISFCGFTRKLRITNCSKLEFRFSFCNKLNLTLKPQITVTRYYLLLHLSIVSLVHSLDSADCASLTLRGYYYTTSGISGARGFKQPVAQKQTQNGQIGARSKTKIPDELMEILLC